MAEYIDREELRAAMQHIYNDPTCPMHIAAEIEQIIDCTPAADVAPVVRCIDCKYCFCNHDGHIQCSNSMGLICPAHNAYCCYGEKV